MNTKYIPILRWKTGEKECLENLSTQVVQNIIPFIEVSPPSNSDTEEAASKKYGKLVVSFNNTWKDRHFYLYLSEDWYEDIDSSDQMAEIYTTFYDAVNHPLAIPAFDVMDEVNISSHSNSPNGVCLRINTNNFETINSTLKDYASNGLINPENTDLLFDLKFIDENLYPQKAALTTAISDVTDISSFRRIIIASCSFPKDLSKLTSGKANEFERYERAIHTIALKLKATFSFNYIYSDYGPQNLNDTAFVIGMIPNFKIKYSTENKYLVVKGFSIKKGGLDLVNVVRSCQIIENHPYFSGSTFSYGDKIISDTANGINTKSGNLTKWVGYSLNHHITLIDSII